MYYAPHTLERRISRGDMRDEHGRLIKGGESWEVLCKCRCDDNMDSTFETDNGKTYRPKYHVVCEGHVDIENGDYVRCMSGDSVRGEGKAFPVEHLNYLPYTELWM